MLNDIAEGVWVIAEQARGTIHRLAREPLTAWIDARRLSSEVAAIDTPTVSPAAGVAVIPLQGLITPFPSLFSLLFGGGGGLQTFRMQLRSAVNNDQVTAIILNVNSPGGRVDLVPEVAAEVRAARDVKPVIAVANTLAASAAYWIASAADEIVVTPSGRVGSIGVFAVHEDWSGFEEQAGIAVTYVSAGEFKVERNPDQPLSQEALDAWQQEVTAIYDTFVADVAVGRRVSASTVRSSFGQGRCVLAAEAKKLGMVDRVATLEETVTRIASGRGGRRKASRATADADTVVAREVGEEIARQQNQILEEQLDAIEAAGDEAAAAPSDGSPEPEPAHPEPERDESYGLDTRRRRLSLVEHRLG